MDCSLARVARFHFAMLDGELGRFFYELPSAHRDRAGVWLGWASRARCRIHLATAAADQANEMGARFTFGRAFALNDSNRGRSSLEFSLAAALPSRSRTLRCRSAAYPATLADWFDHGPFVDRRDDSDVVLRHRR